MKIQITTTTEKTGVFWAVETVVNDYTGPEWFSQGFEDSESLAIAAATNAAIEYQLERKK